MDTVAQRKLPDSWEMHWGKFCLLFLDFTRPNDRDVLARALQDTDSLKTARYTPLRERLVTLLPG